MIQRIQSKLALGLATIAVLSAAACSSTSKSSSSSTPSANATQTAAAVSNDWALKYTGGTAGKADPTKSPIVIGYVNEEGGVPAFPEATAGTKAAVDYINNELGGIGGHPLKLESCAVQTEEDGQRCGTQLVNDPAVRAVLTGVLIDGGASLFKVVGSKLPVVIGNPVSNPDFLTKGAVAFTPGSPGVIQGLGIFAGKILNTPDKPVKRVAIIYGDNSAAKLAVSLLFDPVVKKFGITDIRAVPVPETATAADVQSALQAAGASTADVLASLTTLPLCIATYDALKALGVHPQVVTTGLCQGTPMIQHLKDVGDKGDVPNGWYYTSYGYNPFQRDEASGMQTFVNKIKQYGGANVEFTGFAGPQFGNVLTLAKFFNAIGPDSITADAVKAQIQAFQGPMMMVAGPMTCGKVSPMFPTLCGSEVGVEQYVDGKWVSVADALNGKPIIPTQVLAGA